MTSAHGQVARRYRHLEGRGPVLESWRRGAVWVLVVWVCSRSLLTMVGVLAREWIGQQAGVGNVQASFGIGTGYQWLDIWGAWDTVWYHGIAEAGYATARAANGHGSGFANYAFFPLYPWLTRIIAGGGGVSTYVAGLIVSNLAILLGALVFFRLLELERNRATARRGVLFLFLFPTSYVFSCMMTEGLFISLTISSWFFARRGLWFVACTLAGLSAMTRSFGILLGPFLFWEYLRQRQYRLKAFNPLALIASLVRCLDVRVLWFALVPAGLGVFAWVCWQLTGNPLAFAEAQNAWTGGQRWIDPFSWMLRPFLGINTDNLFYTVRSFGGLFDLLVVITTASLVVIGRRRINVCLVIYSLMIVLLYTLTNVIANNSMARYMVAIFPLYMILASYKLRKPFFLTVVVGLGLIQAVTMALWTNALLWAV